MKRIGTLGARGAVLLLVCLASGCRESESKADLLTISSPGESGAGQGLVVVNPLGDRPTFWDFDRVPYGSRPEHVFRIENREPEPVTIQDMLASCGCTVPRVSYVAADGTTVEGSQGRREPVIVLPPGAVAEVAIRIETSHVERMNVDKLAQVRIRSDSKRTPYLTLELHLVVERTFQAVPPKVEIYESPQSAPRGVRSDVVREDYDTKARILGVDSIEGPFTATLDEIENQGVPVWILVVTPELGLAPGAATGAVLLSATGNDGTGSGPLVRVPVTAQIVPDVVVRPPQLALGSIEPGVGPGASVTLEALVPGERFLVLGATLDGIGKESIELVSTPLDADTDGRATRWKLTLMPTAALSAPEFGGRVRVETDHPRRAVIEVPYSGKLR